MKADFNYIWDLPKLTAQLAGTGGRYGVSPEDFIVEEIPLEEPSGDGDQLWLWVQKRSLGSEALRNHICETLDLRSEDVGIAGRKDRNAVTRQWISVPANKVSVEQIQRLENESVSILKHSHHDHKIRVGRLWGNRFKLVIRGARPGALRDARAILEQIQNEGLPNFFGPQRFGQGGSTLRRGLGMLACAGDGDTVPSGGGKKRRRRISQLDKLALSAAQSWVFNTYLAQRLQNPHGNSWLSPIPGEILLNSSTFLPTIVPPETFGGDAGHDELDQQIAAWKLVAQGPMPGQKMRRCGDIAKRRENQSLASCGLERDAFDSLVANLPGTRRAIRVRPTNLSIETIEPESDEFDPTQGQALRLCFDLPAGAYATVLLGEVMKNKSGEPGKSLPSPDDTQS